jgi:hypothetical protein
LQPKFCDFSHQRLVATLARVWIVELIAVP